MWKSEVKDGSFVLMLMITSLAGHMAHLKITLICLLNTDP